MSQPPLKLSLRPWPVDTELDSAQEIPSFIRRIQSQYGHFRDVSEASLEAEIAAASDPSIAASTPPSQSHPEPSSPPPSPPADGLQSSLASVPTPNPANPNEPGDAWKAKAEMLETLMSARDDAMVMLDYLSLLVSQHQPEMGAATMSPALKQAANPGTMGWDRVTRKIDPKAYSMDEKVTRSWKRAGLNSAADALLGASKTLMTRIDKEEKYWEQVKAIRDEGWAVVRHPREKSVLAVRYGFAEAGDMFREKGIGALRMKDDGSVVMDDVGVTGTHGNALLRVRIVKNGETIGTSVQKERRNGVPGTIRDQIERARNFIYDDELFFEICREARLLANVGVRTEKDSVTIALSDGRCIIIDMQPLDSDTLSDPQDIPASLVPRHSEMAQSILTTLRILLSYCHRASYIRRSQPPAPITPKKPKPPPLSLLRPIATHLFHQTCISHLRSLLTRLTKSAISAGFARAGISFTISPYIDVTEKSQALKKHGEGVETTIKTFSEALESSATVSFPGGMKCVVKFATRLIPPWMGTRFSVTATTTISTTAATGPDAAAAGTGTAENNMMDVDASGPAAQQQQQQQLQLQQHSEFWDVDALSDYLQLCLERGIGREVLGWGLGWKQEVEDGEMTKNIGGMARKVKIVVGREGIGITEGVTGGRDERWVWGEDGRGDAEGRGLREVLERPR